MKYCIKNKAFTLAEVLITLGIIGIVAAITVPTLMNNVQDNQLKTTWKKEFSNLSQATKYLVNDIGGSLVNLCATYNAECLKNYYLNYLTTSKECKGDSSGFRTTYGSCWHNPGEMRYLKGTYVNPTNYNWSPLGDGNAGVILKNGTLVLFEWYDTNCTSGGLGFATTAIKICGWITVDVNGFQQPNTFGKDVFAMWLTKDNLIPMGTPADNDGDSQICIAGNTGGGNYGFGCSAKYLYE